MRQGHIPSPSDSGIWKKGRKLVLDGSNLLFFQKQHIFFSRVVVSPFQIGLTSARIGDCVYGRKVAKLRGR